MHSKKTCFYLQKSKIQPRDLFSEMLLLCCHFANKFQKSTLYNSEECLLFSDLFILAYKAINEYAIT